MTGEVEAGKIAPEGGGDAVAHSEMVSVRFASIISAGLFVMLAAGVILFGGAFVSIRALMRSEAAE